MQAQESTQARAGVNIAAHLDVAVSHVQDQQKEILTVDARSFALGEILKSALDVNVGKGLAARKLNMLGEIEGVACITNSPARMRRLHQAVMLATSIEAIKMGKKRSREEKKQKKEAKAITKMARLVQEAPIRVLLGLPPNTTVTGKAMLEYIQKMKLVLPKVPGPGCPVKTSRKRPI